MNCTGVGTSALVPAPPLNGGGRANAGRQLRVLACSPLAAAFPVPAAIAAAVLLPEPPRALPRPPLVPARQMPFCVLGTELFSVAWAARGW